MNPRLSFTALFRRPAEAGPQAGSQAGFVQNELPILVALALFGLVLCLLAAMFFPDFGNHADQLQTLSSADAGIAV
jgi:hypothetical protein